MQGGLERGEVRAPMDANVPMTSVHIRGYGDVDRSGAIRADPPERSSALVAEHCLRAATEDGGHPFAQPSQFGTPDRIDASSDGVQPTSRHPVLDRVRAEAQREELSVRDDTMLPFRKRPKLRVPSLGF